MIKTETPEEKLQTVERNATGGAESSASGWPGAGRLELFHLKPSAALRRCPLSGEQNPEASREKVEGARVQYLVPQWSQHHSSASSPPVKLQHISPTDLELYCLLGGFCGGCGCL